MGKDGLRQIVPRCFDCPHKKSCLQAALSTREGLVLRNQILDREPAAGFVGRIKRWSERKSLNRLMKLKEGNKI